jgi:hypothetical protein
MVTQTSFGAPSTPKHTRGNPQVIANASSPPYSKLFSSPNVHLHGKTLSSSSTSRHLEGDYSGHGHTPRPVTSWKFISPSGHGSRHKLDTFDFTLWDEAKRDYRSFSDAEYMEVIDRFQAKKVSFCFPFVVVVTEFPPENMPLTIGCAPAVFISPETDAKLWRPQIPFGNTSYTSPSVKCHLPVVRRKWASPSPSEVEQIANYLLEICNVKTLVFSYPFLVVVLHDGDGKTYANTSLPGIVAGWTTDYHRGGDYWGDSSRPLAQESRNREMTPQPNSGIQDQTNYITTGRKFLSPGVRLEGRSRSTTCGVRIKNRDGRIRITVVNHGFADTDEVWHPDGNGQPIGYIKERFELQDIALFEPTDNLPFKNDSYFSSEAYPKNLTKHTDIANGTWFYAEGMSTGLVAFFHISDSFDLPPRETGKRIKYVNFQYHSDWTAHGAVGTAELADGICGAPLVELKPSEMGNSGGGVCGFFQLWRGGGFCSVSALDFLIDDGWALY